jgi:hypothetical protein
MLFRMKFLWVIQRAVYNLDSPRIFISFASSQIISGGKLLE